MTPMHTFKRSYLGGCIFYAMGTKAQLWRIPFDNERKFGGYFEPETYYHLILKSTKASGKLTISYVAYVFLICQDAIYVMLKINKCKFYCSINNISISMIPSSYGFL